MFIIFFLLEFDPLVFSLYVCICFLALHLPLREYSDCFILVCFLCTFFSDNLYVYCILGLSEFFIGNNHQTVLDVWTIIYVFTSQHMPFNEIYGLICFIISIMRNRYLLTHMKTMDFVYYINQPYILLYMLSVYGVSVGVVLCISGDILDHLFVCLGIIFGVQFELHICIVCLIVGTIAQIIYINSRYLSITYIIIGWVVKQVCTYSLAVERRSFIAQPVYSYAVAVLSLPFLYLTCPTAGFTITIFSLGLLRLVDLKSNKKNLTPLMGIIESQTCEIDKSIEIVEREIDRVRSIIRRNNFRMTNSKIPEGERMIYYTQNNDLMTILDQLQKRLTLLLYESMNSKTPIQNDLAYNQHIEIVNDIYQREFPNGGGVSELEFRLHKLKNDKAATGNVVYELNL